MITDHGQARAAVLAEARTWLGTPYHHHARVKGAGVDCAQLLIAVYSACGVAPAIEPGHYAHDWHLHRSEEQFLEWVRTAGAREVETPQPGDFAVFRFGRAFSHGGIMVDDRYVLHAYIDRGVVVHALTDAELNGRPVRFFTLWD